MGTEQQDVTFPFSVQEDGYLHVEVTGDPAYLYLGSEFYNTFGKYGYYFALYVTGNTAQVQFCPVKKGDVITDMGQRGNISVKYIPKS